MKQLERKDGGNKAKIRDPARSERMREALKMKYVMGVEAAGGGRFGGVVGQGRARLRGWAGGRRARKKGEWAGVEGGGQRGAAIC